MNIHESDSRLALQAETEAEQSALHTLFERTEGAYMTLDVPGYDGLDENLHESRIFAPQDGLDQPGARALVVPTGMNWARIHRGGGFAKDA